MKTIFGLALLLSCGFCQAQRSAAFDSSIELNIQLIEDTRSGELALNVKVFNHSGKDIYIPTISYSTVHLYEQSDSGWKEMDLYTHTPYPRSLASQVGYHTADIGEIVRRGNDVTKYYSVESTRFFSRQFHIIDAFCQQNPAIQKSAILGKVVFLKAGEEAAYYLLIPMDYLKQQPKNYKISYGTEARDPATIDRDNRAVLQLPEKIFSFERYVPGPLKANTLYYSSIN